jgi:hypothetical protein
VANRVIISVMMEKAGGMYVLTSWYRGDYEQIADARRGQMDKGRFQRILDAFSFPLPALKPVAEKIRSTLFPFKDRLFTGTPKDPSIFYNPIIRAFSDAADNLPSNMVPD